MDIDDVDVQEELFHNAVREYTVLGLLFMFLYIISFITLAKLRRKTDCDDYFTGDEDALVYKISLWLCTFTLAVSLGAVLLLPISIFSNEILRLYPSSYYMQWLNSSLIQGVWNSVSLCSNLSLFVLMPFAYLFTESEGFAGSKKGIMSRVYETITVLVLLIVLIFGLAWVASAMLDESDTNRKALFDVWDFYLPFLYSCVSLFGVGLLLVCTPIGFARLFTIMGQLISKPKLFGNLSEELTLAQFEEQALTRRDITSKSSILENGWHSLDGSGNNVSATDANVIDNLQNKIKEMERHMKVSSLRRNVCYPLTILILLSLTAVSVFIVVVNTLNLLVGQKSLPVAGKQLVLGSTSLSTFGLLGAAFESVLIIYLMIVSVVGFYTLPVLWKLRPKMHDTSLTSLIGNCVVIIILSSALPVLSRILGLTNFDLLGNFSRLEWLRHLSIVLLYNVIFAIATALCLVNKFTAPLRREILFRLTLAWNQLIRLRDSAFPRTISNMKLVGDAAALASKDD